MTVSSKAPKLTQNFWVSDNRGINSKGGVDYYLMEDRATDRKSAETMVVGGKPYSKLIEVPGGGSANILRAPFWSKIVPVQVGAQPAIQGQRIIRGSMVKETTPKGRERYVIANGTEDPNHYVTVKVGYDPIEDQFRNRSPANHRRQIMVEKGRLFQFGVIAFDSDALKLLTAEEGDLSEILKNPNLPMPGGKAEQQGKTKNTGKFIPEIDCFETEVSQWMVKPRDMLLKVTAWGEVRLIRLVGGIMTEKTTNDPLLVQVAVRGVAAEKHARRAEAIARRKVLKPDGNAVEEAPAATQAA